MLSKFVAVIIVCVVIFCPSFAAAQSKIRQTTGDVATSFRLEQIDKYYTWLNRLHITVRGKQRRVAEPVFAAWIINNGRDVIYSDRNGSGGYENEGQALHIYNVATGKTREILSEYYGIDRVTEVGLTNGKRALVVEMSDGGLGASYFAVVDPARGQTFRREFTALRQRRGDFIVLRTYKPDDWGVLLEGSAAEKKRVKPTKIERLDLKALLGRAVIVNKREQR